MTPTHVSFVPRDITDPPNIPLEIEPVERMKFFLDEPFDELRYWRASDDTAPFITGDLGYGISEIVDGSLHMYPPETNSFYLYPSTPGALRNGVIQTRITIEGAGYDGVVARASRHIGGDSSDSTASMYACLVSQSGAAGCYAIVDNEWVTLFECACAVKPSNTYTLTLVIVKNVLQFRIDGTVIGTIEDDTRATGDWGIFAENYGTAATSASFDYVTIAEFPDDYILD